jgi:hypothetical protein
MEQMRVGLSHRGNPRVGVAGANMRSCVEAVTAAMRVDKLDSAGFSTMVNEFTLSLREAIRASRRENRERSFEAEGPWHAGGPSACRPHR